MGSQTALKKLLCLAGVILAAIIALSTIAHSEDDLLAGEDDLTTEEPAQKDESADGEEEEEKEEKTKVERAHGNDPHMALLTAEEFPSAAKCASCHAEIYDEWRRSNHAYASISPMFHKFEQKINDLTQGSIANFCVRCHVSVGTTLKEPRHMPIWDRAQVSREGITCVTCHRVNEEFGKVNGERRMIPGNIFKPMYGHSGSDVLKSVIDQKDFYKVRTQKAGRGMRIHNEAIKFDSIRKSEFCLGCHQVAVHPGIKLEVVWDQYRASPAFKNGVSCQDCHMGKNPGRPDGYATGPAAVVNGKAINPNRRRSNHAFYGPGYPIAHPGIFPHNAKGSLFEVKDWLTFDYRSDWGKPDFERKIEKGEIEVKFPEAWEDIDDRIEARRIVEDNLKILEVKKQERLKVMENGSKIEGPFFDDELETGEGLSFHYVITNTNTGHNLPSGSLGAQPEIWFNVALQDPDGKTVWESGYVDSYGDMCDIHSEDVQKGKIDHDDQLFNLQTKFLTTNIKGTDREMLLPVNFDLDQRPLIRPAGAPNSVLNHPAFIRMEGRSIPPLGNRKAKYYVPAKLMQKPGKYKLSARMRSRAEPIYFMRFVEATEDMIRSMNQWMADIHPYTVEFEVKAKK